MGGSGSPRRRSPTDPPPCAALALTQDNLAIQQNKTKLVIDQTSVKFPESNLMHMMNGYIACNGPTLQLQAGSRVRWLVMGFGSEVDMHSPVFEGQAVDYAGAGASWLTATVSHRVSARHDGASAPFISADC